MKLNKCAFWVISVQFWGISVQLTCTDFWAQTEIPDKISSGNEETKYK